MLRVVLGTGALLIFLVAGLSIWLWPKFSDLDTYRPRIIGLLSDAAQRPVTIGHLEARLFPQPRLVARQVTLFSHDTPDRPFVSAGQVSLRFYFLPVLHGQFRPRIVTFEEPRLFLTRDTTSWAQILDQGPALQSQGKNLSASSNPFPLERVDVMGGVLTLTDNGITPARQQRLEQLTGSYFPMKRQADVQGLAPSWGMPARFTLHVDQNASYPYDLRVEGVRLRSFEAYFPAMTAWLSGTLSGHLRIKNKSALEFRIERLALARFPGLVWKAQGSVAGERLASNFEVSGTSSPMHGDLHCLLRSDPLDIQATMSDYAPEIAARLTQIPWITRLAGPGYARFTLRRSRLEHNQEWQVEGGSFTFAGTSLQVRELRVSGTNDRIEVQTGLDTLNGQASVVWSKPLKKEISFLSVTASSLTVHEILPIFNVPADLPEHSTGTLRSRAWETLHLSNVRMSARIYPHKSFVVRKAVLNIEEAAVRLTGTFGLQGKGAPAHIDGKADHVPIEPFWNRFFTTRAYVTGGAGFEFNFDFPLISSWVEGLDGTLSAHAENGVVRSFKTLYDVLSVTNLTNYLTLHLPHFHDEGIPYETLSGHFTIEDGILSSKDVFMKTENSNIAAEGVVDMPGQEIDATLRVQFFRLIEDVLRAIPGVKWILNDQHKILLPIIVKVRGPWKQVEVE